MLSTGRQWWHQFPAPLRELATVRLVASFGAGGVLYLTPMVFHQADFSASQVGSGSDWLVYLPDGLATVDVRIQLRTDDGADLLVRYTGRSDVTAGHITTSVLFETGHPDYAWLNRVMAVGRGHTDLAAQQVRYDVFEVQ